MGIVVLLKTYYTFVHCGNKTTKPYNYMLLIAKRLPEIVGRNS